ncbi:MAG: 1-deoxy-D-xylulose-5-phosphate synthase, partial [Clostridiales bacterium]|nr:1-deoxy-D-xylulose-5-phosphate synthase [Clostridiales bacterium]
MDFQQVWTPQKLKQCSPREVEELIPQLREQIIDAVSQTGGHLASNLGVVELTLALHRVFDSPRDKIVFDVGHQCYAHKILTGRGKQMQGLRQYGGISGFPKREESPHDAFGTGHASTALSAALGMARARDLKGEDHHVVVVVSDGALTGGMCYEALNDAGCSRTPLIAILNDNQMSIAANVGAVSGYLTYMRTSKGWLTAKKIVAEGILRLPLVGKPLHRVMQRVKNDIRNIFIKDKFFDGFGFRYLGPVDGHDEQGLERFLKRAKRFSEPVLLHVVTTKGKGYAVAESDPSRAHGMPAFDPQDGSPKHKSSAKSFGTAAGKLLTSLAEKDERIVAITAAMADSTGLGPFQQAYPKRLFDVGIAEEHAVTMAAGFAASGMRPVVAIYDTFMQRTYDQMMVDVCLQNLPVIFLGDRAALGGEDGATHHGIYGANFMRQMPNMQVLNPRSVQEMELMIRLALSQSGPCAIRYPKAEHPLMAAYPCKSFSPGKWEELEKGQDITLVATGPMVAEALIASHLLR